MTPSWIIITGASRGIGAAIAEKLAAPGIHLALLARTESALDDIAKRCEALGATVAKIPADLSDMEHVRRAWSAIDALGGGAACLVNNAGIWDERNIATGGWESWEKALDANLKAPMLLTTLALSKMTEGSSVAFIGSAASRRAYAGGTNYCAGKFGLLGFAGALFEDVRERGIKVFSILPGQVDTDMHKGEAGIDPSKLIAPSDIAEALAYALQTPARVCPVEIMLAPQRNPKSRT